MDDCKINYTTEELKDENIPQLDNLRHDFLARWMSDFHNNNYPPNEVACTCTN